MIKNKKGFTLVELLAVLLVLVIIVLIAVNVINSRVKEAKKNAVEVNANNYIKAVNGVAALSQNIGEDMEKGTFEVRDLNKKDIKISGEKPRRGFLVLSNYDVSYGCLMYDTYSAVIVDGKTASIIKGNCKEEMFAANYDYTGSEQVFTANVDGWYKLEVWGAQGGDAYNMTGGYGGYSVGLIKLSANDKLYINVGGKGNNRNANGTEVVNGNGYNGGGTSTQQANTYVGGGGGGATSIATSSGLLINLSSHSENVIIVAGGGGGASYGPDEQTSGIGGHAGGYIAKAGENNGSRPVGYGGTQTAGGTSSTSNTHVTESGFGKGCEGSSSYASYTQISGGGGYYGGGCGEHAGGGGGSSYIANSNLYNKSMYCYNCTQSDVETTKTISTTCTNENPTEKCSKIGSGYASIKFVATEVQLDVKYEFAYTGDEKVITVPSTGKYKLEVWGAQGGEASSTLGGYGGYAVGEVTLQKGTKLYINVGGKGDTRYYSSGYTAPGGYNGGANGYNNKTWGYVGAGGGATSIATKTGLLKDIVSDSDNLLIVAGGGGGAFFYNNTYRTKNAGHGGGKEGVNCTSDSSTPGAGGTQDSNYGEGQAINATSGETPGGGGGYRGGETRYHCGGGGSGYIANSLLSNKKMVCYGCVEDSNINTKTISTSCVNETPTSDCAKINGGYVRITTVK